MPDRAEQEQVPQLPEDLMIEQGVWPRTGGWWHCVDHGFFSSIDLVDWKHPEGGVPLWQCPKCGRRDLIQYEQALIAVPAAHHGYALKAERAKTLRDVEEALRKLPIGSLPNPGSVGVEIIERDAVLEALATLKDQDHVDEEAPRA